MKNFKYLFILLCVTLGWINVTKAQDDLTFAVNGVSFTMKYVEGGTFWMGAQSDDPEGINYDAEAESWEKPIHSVTLSPYYIAETEVTNALWIAVMGKTEIEVAEDFIIELESDDHPMYGVNWNDCQHFINKLNEITGKDFRMPSSAEWEYAAKGGNKSLGCKYAGSNEIDNVAWYWNRNIAERPSIHSVGTKRPNELGLYDMSGNVAEWCYDWATGYTSDAQVDPFGPKEPIQGFYCVVRGGFYASEPKDCRITYWIGLGPEQKETVGLRLVLPQ